jgi:hypothetical protein
MQRNTFLAASLCISSALNAQITISSADMPNAGDSTLISVTNSVGTNNPALTGANYIWNYSSLTPTQQQYAKFDSPHTYSTPFNYLFTPANTSYGKNNYQFTAIPLPGAKISAAYDFFKETSLQLKQIGSGYTVNGIPLPFLYTSDDVVYNFPMNYLNIDSCDYKFGLPIPTIGYYGQKGHRVNIIDGWGTLTTPFGTFQTLRIKSTIAAIDTIFYRPLKYEFKWWANGMEIPVLEIDSNVVVGTSITSNVIYIDSARAGVPQVGIAVSTLNNLKFSAYPNPCVDKVILRYNLTKPTEVKISITDIIGKKIADVVDENQISGTHQKSISIVDLKLTSGIYFLSLQTNNFKENHKIIVAN